MGARRKGKARRARVMRALTRTAAAMAV